MPQGRLASEGRPKEGSVEPVLTFIDSIRSSSSKDVGPVSKVANMAKN